MPNTRPEKVLTVLEEPLRDIYDPHWSTGADDVPDAGTPDEAVYLPGRNVLLTVKASVFRSGTAPRCFESHARSISATGTVW